MTVTENPREPAPKSRRGGKRPGAGAPRGNMNALKTGAYSRQFAQLGALLASDPALREVLLALGRKHQLKQNRANQIAALLLTRLVRHADGVAGGRLNLPVPADDWESITAAAGQIKGTRYDPSAEQRISSG